MATTQPVPRAMPPETGRPGSLGVSDAYGAYYAGVPTTSGGGTTGAARAAAASRAHAPGPPPAPVQVIQGIPAMLTSPAGLILAGIGFLFVLSLERGR